MRLPAAILAVLAVTAATAYALPPGAAERGLREGANHRAGDDSFVAAFGRLPNERDGEELRMRTHLAYIHDRLAAGPATRPALAARRAELLGYLADYIASGVTPQNVHLPWRSPVFIDDGGRICAVGYLIERSAGRALPERIARLHRHDFLEDIAAAMPEVRAWIGASGLTLDELASIQPGYREPGVESFRRMDLAKRKVPDGPYVYRDPSGETRGTIRAGRMEGAWTQRVGDQIVGAGELHRGAGTWRSFYASGALMARGPFANNDPHGTWTLYFPSGHIAAVGRFERGYRHGTWSFFHDTAAGTLLARGAFRDGMLAGRWEHFDARGRLLAVASGLGHRAYEGPPGGSLLEIRAGRTGLHREVHHFGGVDQRRLDALLAGDEQLYLHNRYGEPTLYDADGRLLERFDGVWEARDCRWSRTRRRIARAGDTVTLHRLLDGDALAAESRRIGSGAGAQSVADTHGCAPAVPVPAARAARLDAILAAADAVRAPAPEHVRELARRGHTLGGYADLAPEAPDRGDGDRYEPADPSALTAAAAAPEGMRDALEPGFLERERAGSTADLAKLLATSYGWYVEWPHIDGRFIQVFHTLPGYIDRSIAEEPEADAE
jgi:hypothetical protein